MTDSDPLAPLKKTPVPSGSGLKNPCARCGACLAVCPVYETRRHERFSPRGKERLLAPVLGASRGPMALLSPSREALSPPVRETVEACLQCGACASVCVAGVEVDRTVREARALEPGGMGPPSWAWELLKRRHIGPGLLAAISAIPGVSGLFMRLSGLGGREGRRRLLLPSFARRPAVTKGPVLKPARSRGFPGRAPRIALFAGCVQNLLFPEIVEAMVESLGVEVLVPEGQGCCGLPAWTAGARSAARDMARRNFKAYRGLEADFIVTGCASCATMLRNHWGEAMGAKEEIREKVSALTAKVIEFGELISMLGFPEQDRGIDASVSYHVPCHQRYGLGSAASLENVIGAVAADVRPMSQGCCGFGGVFALKNPELSSAIFAGRLAAWEASGASVVVTTCSGCLLQWRGRTGGLDEAPKVLHLAEFLALGQKL